MFTVPDSVPDYHVQSERVFNLLVQTLQHSKSPYIDDLPPSVKNTVVMSPFGLVLPQAMFMASHYHWRSNTSVAVVIETNLSIAVGFWLNIAGLVGMYRPTERWTLLSRALQLHGRPLPTMT